MTFPLAHKQRIQESFLSFTEASKELRRLTSNVENLQYASSIAGIAAAVNVIASLRPHMTALFWLVCFLTTCALVGYYFLRDMWERQSQLRNTIDGIDHEMKSIGLAFVLDGYEVKAFVGPRYTGQQLSPFNDGNFA